jgi:TonB-dependent receptor
MKKYKVNYLSMLISSLLCTSVMAQVSPEKLSANTESNKSTSIEKKQKISDAENTKEETEAIEVIEIQGIRGSLIKSVAIKRNSTNVVDAISAEDVGKLPDVNIADALSRISGVTVNRDSNTGRAKSINVRGLSGDYNITTLNGRKLATTNAGRDFHYDVLSSGIISRIEVAKSPLAHMAAGGIGASIDIHTVRPLAKEDTEFVVKFDDYYQELSEKHNPKFSLYSNYNHDGIFGVAAGIIYSETSSRNEQYNGQGMWRDKTVTVQEFGEKKQVESDLRNGSALRNGLSEEERLSANVTLQWLPTSDLDITFDALYSTYDQHYTGSRISLNSSQAQYDNHGIFSYIGLNDSLSTPRWDNSTGDPRIDDNDDLVYLPVGDQIYIEDTFLIDLTNQASSRNTETQSYGLNLEYSFEEVTLAFDASHSSAVNKNKGDNYFVVLRSAIEGASFDYRTGNTLPDIILSEQLDASAGWGAHYNTVSGIGSEDTVDSIKIDGEWTPDIDWIEGIKFGVGATRQTKQTDTYIPQPGGPRAFRNGTILGSPITDEAELISRGNFNFLRIPDDVLTDSRYSNFLGSEAGNFPRQWVSFDVDRLFDFYGTVSPEARELMNPIQDLSQTYTIEETLGHLYLEANLSFDFFGHPLAVNVGGRAIELHVEAEGKSQRADRIARDFLGNPIDQFYATETKMIKEVLQYEFLPSLTANLKLFDDYVIKFATAKTVSRPSLAEMRPYESIVASSSKTENGNQIWRSNPALKPYTSTNIDLSFEWYFSDVGALALGFYYKDIEGFVTDTVTFEEIDGWDFKVNSVANNDENSKIKGVEVLWQQSLDEILPEALEGFGFTANYTYTDTGNGDLNALGWEVGFEGMSQSSYNFQFFYDVENFSTRIAFQHRDEYLLRAAASLRERDTYIPESDFLTWSMNYAFTDTYSMTAAIDNLTDENSTRISREIWGDDLRNLSHNGRTYTIGFQAKF